MNPPGSAVSLSSRRAVVLILGLVTILGVTGLAALWLQAAQAREFERVLEEHKTELRLGLLHDAQTRVQVFFKNVYETARTISLIPGVRNARGTNRTSPEEDVVATGRFDPESDIVVRNLYLNLSSNFTVSEVYCVMEGLDPTKGQVPFFMYDSVVTGLSQGQADGPDNPPANETLEYTYYPVLLKALKKSNPVYAYPSLSSIPVAYSEPMLTCDNTQFTSLKDGDPARTLGLISSVPFYSSRGTFRGIISVVYRLDALRSLLLNLPFLPYTEADKTLAKEKGFSLSPDPIPLLVEAPFGVLVADPRQLDLPGKVLQARSEKNPDLLSVDLGLPGGPLWRLDYLIGAQEKAGLFAKQKATDGFQWLTLGLVAMALLLEFLLMWNENRRRETLLLQLAGAVRGVGEGDLKIKLTMSQKRGAVQDLGTSFAGMVSSIRKIVEALKATLETSTMVSRDLASSSEEASVTLSGIRQNLAEISTVVAGLEELVGTTMGAISQHAQAENLVRTNVQDLERRVGQTASFVQMSMTSIAGLSSTMGSQSNLIKTLGLESQSARNRMNHAAAQLSKVQLKVDAISDTVSNIGDITTKTKLLAMNAAIEAAHAGSSGRGFAVVSQNIRSLAEETEKQSLAITYDLKDLVESLATANEAQTWTASHLSQLLDNFEDLGRQLTDISANLTELGSGSQEVLADLGENEKGSHRVVESLNRMEVESAQLVSRIQELVHLAQTTSRQTRNLEAAMMEVGTAVQSVADAGTKNMAGVESLVVQASRFKD